MASIKRVRAGKAAKRHGSTFERLIVKKLKEAGIEVDRHWWQGQIEAAGTGKAKIPDLGVPWMWAELGDGAAGVGGKKLQQARADLERYEQRLEGGRDHAKRPLYPVAITRKSGTRQILVTLDLDHLVELTLRARLAPTVEVQIELDDFIRLIQGMEKDEEDQDVSAPWEVY